jgi:hypothetical protein
MCKLNLKWSSVQRRVRVCRRLACVLPSSFAGHVFLPRLPRSQLAHISPIQALRVYQGVIPIQPDPGAIASPDVPPHPHQRHERGTQPLPPTTLNTLPKSPLAVLTERMSQTSQALHCKFQTSRTSSGRINLCLNPILSLYHHRRYSRRF